MHNYKRFLLKITMLLFCILFAVSFINRETAHATPRRVGWVQSGKDWYHYQNNGKLTRGFKRIGNHRYYFNTNSGKMLSDSWRKINGKHYFFEKNGQMARNRWVRDVYYVNKNGVRQTNKWIGEYFVGNNGKWIKNFNGGWQKISSKWYFYSKNGRKRTGWLNHNNKRYYLNKNGVMVTGRRVIRKKTYQFTKNGALRINGWYKSGRWYYHSNKDGVVNTTERMNTKSRRTASIIENNSKTLKVRIEKKRQFNTNYWVAQVETAKPKQLVHSLAHASYGGARETTSAATKRNNAILGINGSAFSYATGRPSPDGMCIVNGRVFSNRATSHITMNIMKDGTLSAGPSGLWANELLRRGVRSTLNFGPIILRNGKTVPFSQQGNPFTLVSYQDPRTVIGMVRPNKYVVLVADGRQTTSRGLNHAQMVSIMRSYKCSFAYNLDGGGSTTISYRGTVLNSPSDGRERPCADFLLFKK